jgi:hypothetical protein
MYGSKLDDRGLRIERLATGYPPTSIQLVAGIEWDSAVAIHFGKIPLYVRDDGDSKSVISSKVRNLSCSLRPSQNQTEPLPLPSDSVRQSV